MQRHRSLCGGLSAGCEDSLPEELEAGRTDQYGDENHCIDLDCKTADGENGSLWVDEVPAVDPEGWRAGGTIWLGGAKRKRSKGHRRNQERRDRRLYLEYV